MTFLLSFGPWLPPHFSCGAAAVVLSVGWLAFGVVRADIRGAWPRGGK